MVRLTISLSEENYAVVRELARAAEVSLSEALNRLVEQHRSRPVAISLGPDGFPLVTGLAAASPDSRDVEAEDDLEALRRVGMLR